MKRLRLVFMAGCFVLIAFTSAAWSQLGIRKSVRAGYTWSHFSTEYSNDQQKLKTWTAGIGLELRLFGTIAFEGEALYSTYGTIALMPSKNEEIRLNYISFPIVVKYTFFPILIRPYILGGVEFGTLLSAKQDGEDIMQLIQGRDKNWVIGCGTEVSLLGKGFFIEGRMHLGGNDVFKEKSLRGVQNVNSQIIIGFMF